MSAFGKKPASCESHKPPVRIHGASECINMSACTVCPVEVTLFKPVSTAITAIAPAFSQKLHPARADHSLILHQPALKPNPSQLPPE